MPGGDGGNYAIWIAGGCCRRVSPYCLRLSQGSGSRTSPEGDLMRGLSSNTSKRAVLLTPAALAVCALLLSGLTGERVRHATAAQTPDAARVATVVLDDSAFYGEMPKG